MLLEKIPRVSGHSFGVIEIRFRQPTLEEP
jgi:hypothetical protein